MNKINDLRTDLDINLVAFEKKEINNTKDEVINDIYSDKSLNDIDLSLNKNIKIIKLKSNNFDSFFSLKNQKKLRISNFIKLNFHISKKKYNLLVNENIKNNKISIKLKLFLINKFKLVNDFDISSFSWKAFNSENKEKIVEKIWKIKNLYNKKNPNFDHKKFWKNKNSLPYVLKKSLLISIFIIFILLWNKVIVQNLITSWYNDVLSIKDLWGNISAIESNIDSSNNKFMLWWILFKPFTIIPNKNVDNVDYIIKWGSDISDLLTLWLNLYKYTHNKIILLNDFKELNFIDLLSEIRSEIEGIDNLLYSSLNNYYKIWSLWDDYLDEKLDYAKSLLKKWLLFTDIIEKNYDILLSMLWNDSQRKYLVLFQNNDEIRATWWFIWSMGFVTIKNWKIKSIDNTDVYALEWLINKVYTEKEIAPEWLNKITETFWLRDANYYPEIKDSSAKIKFFLDKIDYKIDWIVYINQDLILDLLDDIWWVDSKSLWESIDSSNFSLILSTLVEAKVFKVWTLWTPKQALFDFADEFFAKLLEKKNYYSYAKIISKHIKSRDIIFYSFNSEENSFLWKLWINWEINFKEKLDFNYPVYSSIWWNKTDRYLDYRFDKTISNLEWTCDFNSKLDIYSTHYFSKSEEEHVNQLLDKYNIIDKTDILNIQWKADNKSFLRVLLPKNTVVFPSENQKVYEYDKYKILELYTYTRNLETSHYTINYNVINDKCEDYSYKFLKQPWIKDYNINFDINWEVDKYMNISSDFYYYK